MQNCKCDPYSTGCHHVDCEQGKIEWEQHKQYSHKTMQTGQFEIIQVPSNFTDQPGQFMRVEQVTPNCKEIDFFDDLTQPNVDIPDQLHHFEQGTAQRINDHLDDTMNDRDFRERCTQYGGRNYFVFRKTAVDLEPPQHLRPEWIAGKLDITMDVALKFVESFKALGFDRKTALRYLFNEVICAPEWEADRLEQIALAIKEPDWAFQDNYWATVNDDQISDDWIYMTDEVIEQLKTEHDELLNNPFDNVGDTNPFGAHPLSWGAEGLSHEAIVKIKTASYDQLLEMQKGFFPAKKGARPKYWWMTDPQKARAWIYIKERKAKLQQLSYSEMSTDCANVLSWIKDMGRCKASSAMIFAFADGKPYDFNGIEFKFERKATALELKLLWAEYKKL